MILKVKFLRSDKDGWDYLKGPTEAITVPEDILLSDLSVLIRDTFGIPEGRSYAFYMMNTVRPSPYQYSDLVEDGYLDGGKTTLKQALQGPKFKYEYSFSDGLIFQCEVKDQKDPKDQPAAEKLLGVGDIGGTTLAVGGFQFQLTTICRQFTTLRFQPNFKHTPVL